MCRGLRILWHSARVFGDKSPGYCFSWPILRSLFPDCNILAMDRDVDAAARSVARQTWGTHDVNEARRQVASYRDAVVKCPDAHWVRLDDLRGDAERVLSELLAWLRLPRDKFPMERAVAIVHGPPVN